MNISKQPGNARMSSNVQTCSRTEGMCGLRDDYNNVVAGMKKGTLKHEHMKKESEVLCLLNSVPPYVHGVDMLSFIDTNSMAPGTSFEFELLNSTSFNLAEKCLELLRICDTDEYSKFIIYRLHIIYDAQLDSITSPQAYLNTMNSILGQDGSGYGYIPTNLSRFRKMLISAPYSYAKQRIVEKLQDRVNLGLQTCKFTPIDNEFRQESINWNIIVASNRFITIKFDTFISITGITELELLQSVSKLAMDKKIVVKIDQVGKVLTFPLNKIDLQHELNNFFKAYLPNALEDFKD